MAWLHVKRNKPLKLVMQLKFRNLLKKTSPGVKVHIARVDFVFDHITLEIIDVDSPCLPLNCYVVTYSATAVDLSFDYSSFVDAISNNTVNSFFETERNYSELFPFLIKSSNSDLLFAFAKSVLSYCCII